MVLISHVIFLPYDCAHNRLYYINNSESYGDSYGDYFYFPFSMPERCHPEEAVGKMGSGPGIAGSCRGYLL